MELASESVGTERTSLSMGLGLSSALFDIEDPTGRR